MRTLRYGMTVGGPIQEIGSLARAIEDRGFDSVWSTETSNGAFTQATLVAQATSRVRVGTGIALAFPRSPGIAALNAMDLDELSGGRFTLGLGSQVKRVNEQRFSTPFEHPAPKMKEYAQAVRAFWDGYAGEEPKFEGRFYTVTMAPWPRLAPPVRPQVPIFLAAVNRGMLRVAGAVADGVIGHPLTSTRYVREVIRPTIARAAARAGRGPDEVELVQSVLVSISDDRELARREVCQQIGFYATTRTYAPVLALHGFEAVIPELRRAYAARDMDAMAALVTEEMATAYALFGPADDVRQLAGEWEGLAGELLLGGPWYRVDPGRLLENHAAILETFGAG